jgi:signal transduction histidine kinase
VHSLLKPRHWFDYVLFGIRTLWFAAGMNHIVSHPEWYAHGDNLLGVTGLLWLILAWYTVVYLVPMALFFARKKPDWVPVVAELALSGGFYCFLEAGSSGAFAFFNFPILAMGYMSASRVTAGLTVASAFVIPFAANAFWGFGVESAFDKVADLVILSAIGLCFRKMVSSFLRIKEMNRIIGEQNRTLELYAKQIEELTLSEERNRLSRELHDTVGHTFTTVITGMDAAYYLIDADPAEAKKGLRELLHVTRDGLDEVRRHIHSIAPEREERVLSAVLSDLAQEFTMHTGTRIEFRSTGSESPVSEAVRVTLVRCLQESLTNAKKHGNAAHVEVELSFRPGAVGLSVADDGSGTEQLSAGFGLRAMRERVSNLQGSLNVSSAAGEGTRVVCELPVGRVTMKASETAI